MIELFTISSTLIILGFIIMFFIEKYKENKRLNDLLNEYVDKKEFKIKE
jgi:hypothetical protein